MFCYTVFSLNGHRKITKYIKCLTSYLYPQHERWLLLLWNSISWFELAFRWSSYAQKDLEMGAIHWENVCAWWSAEGGCKHGSVSWRRRPLPMWLQNYLQVSFYVFKEGGHWGVLNTAIPQKNSAHTAIPQKKSPNTATPQHQVETRWNAEISTLYVKLSVNNIEITIQSLLMNVKSGSFRFRQNKQNRCNMHWRVG